MHEDEECMHRMEFNPSESSTDCIIAAAVECSETEQTSSQNSIYRSDFWTNI